MRILIVGAGGVGGYFGGRLVESGAEVSFLVRAVRARQLAKHGLVIESQLGGSRQSVTTMTSVEGIEPPDIIIVACKAYSLDSVLDAISDVVRPGTVILPLLNGVAHLEVIDQRFPKAMVWAGLAYRREFRRRR